MAAPGARVRGGSHQSCVLAALGTGACATMEGIQAPAKASDVSHHRHSFESSPAWFRCFLSTKLDVRQAQFGVCSPRLRDQARLVVRPDGLTARADRGAEQLEHAGRPAASFQHSGPRTDGQVPEQTVRAVGLGPQQARALAQAGVDAMSWLRRSQRAPVRASGKSLLINLAQAPMGRMDGRNNRPDIPRPVFRCAVARWCAAENRRQAPRQVQRDLTPTLGSR